MLKTTNQSLESAVKLRENELSDVRHCGSTKPDGAVSEIDSRKCLALEIEQESLINRIKSLEKELASVQAEKSQEESLNYIVMSEYFEEDLQSSAEAGSDEVNSEQVDEQVSCEEDKEKTDTLMGKIARLQTQLKEKNKEISNLKSNLGAQENLTKTYFNEIEQLTLKLNAKEADLTRNTEVVDILINQQRESISGGLASVPSQDLSDNLSSDVGIERYDDSGDDCAYGQNDNISINVGTVAASHACPLFFRFGDAGCPEADCCGRSHNSEILHKKGACFKDFEREGSCPRKDQCWFSHENPELRVNTDFKKFMKESMKRAE